MSNVHEAFVAAYERKYEVGQRAILNGGDGTAGFAISFRQAFPDAADWQVADAVSAYRQRIGKGVFQSVVTLVGSTFYDRQKEN